jgi:colicin import membrane protein
MTGRAMDLRDMPRYEGIKAARWTWPIIWAILLYTALIMIALIHFPEFKQKETSRFMKAQVVTLPSEEKPTKLPAKPQAKPKPVEKKAKPIPKKAKEPVKTPPKGAAKPPAKVEASKPIAKPNSALAKQQAKAEKQHQDWLEQQWVSTLNELDEELAVEEKVTEKAAASYIQAIQSQVSRFWQYPPSARRTMEVILEIKLIPTGEVIDVKVVSSSGNISLDRSARQALIKASPLPVPEDIRLFEKYFRTLTMPFRPEDARL